MAPPDTGCVTMKWGAHAEGKQGKFPRKFKQRLLETL